MVREGRVLGGEAGRKGPVHAGVEHLGELSKADLAHQRDGETVSRTANCQYCFLVLTVLGLPDEPSLLHRVSDAAGHESSAVVGHLVLEVDQGVVGGRLTSLEREDSVSVNHVADEGAEPLGA